MVKNLAVIMLAAVVVIILETLRSYKLTSAALMMQIQHQSRQIQVIHNHKQNVICNQLTVYFTTLLSKFETLMNDND